jgi:hypothetical protein
MTDWRLKTELMGELDAKGTAKFVANIISLSDMAMEQGLGGSA